MMRSSVWARVSARCVGPICAAATVTMRAISATPRRRKRPVPGVACTAAPSQINLAPQHAWRRRGRASGRP